VVSESIQGKDGKEGLELLSSKIVEQTNYDFTLIATPGDSMTIQLDYNGNMYDEAVVNRIGNHLKRIIEEIVKNPSITFNELEYISKEEKVLLLDKFNDTAVEYPKDKTVIELFEEQAEKTPDNIAVVFEEKELTYKELNERANQLARYLQKKYAITADDLVGIMLERSEWMII